MTQELFSFLLSAPGAPVTFLPLCDGYRAMRRISHLQHVPYLLVLVLACFGLEKGTRAQPTAPATGVPIRPSDVSVKTWTTADGLPVNHINDIVQTSDGYLWVATGGGLARFDGRTFDVFTREDIEGWTTSYVAGLHRGRGNCLWLVSEAGELACHSGGEFRTWPGLQVQDVYHGERGSLWFGGVQALVRVEDTALTRVASRQALPHPAINDMYRESLDRTWIATPAGLAQVGSGEPVVYGTEEGLPSDDVLKVYEDAAGRLTVVTTRGLARLAKTTGFVPVREGTIPDSIQSAFVDRNRTLWLATDTGVTRVGEGSARTVEVPVSLGEGVRDWAKTGAGTVWIAHGNGLVRVGPDGVASFDREIGAGRTVNPLHVDGRGNLWMGVEITGLMRVRPGAARPQVVREAPEMKAVPTLYEDAEGNVWVGTDIGLLRVTHRKFDVYTSREGLTEEFLFPIHGDREGGIWLGTWGGGVHRIQDGRLISYTIDDGLQSNYVRALEEGRDGVLWVGTTEGLCRLPGGQPFALPEGKRWIRAILEDRSGTLWVGGNGFLTRMTDRGLVRVSGEPGKGPSVWALHEDRTGRLWAGTDSGLYQRDGERWIKYTTADGLSSNHVASIHEDRDGTLWFGTRAGGLNRYANGTFTVYTAQDGLLSNGVWSILEDDQDRYWMSSNEGLFRVSEREMDAFASGKIEEVTPVVYTEPDGLPTAEFNSAQPAAWSDEAGRLWFPTIKGAVVVDPDNVHKNERPPPVHIERVLANGKPVVQGTGSAFRPDVKTVEFRYTALSLVAPRENAFQYKLEGYDDAWRTAGNRRMAFYTNLPPGSYTFRVRAANSDGVWNETGASFAFRLRPFFYETWWFYLLCGGAGLLLLGGAYTLRVRYLREQELEQKVRERTHELEAEKSKTEAQAETLMEQAIRLRRHDRMKNQFFENVSHGLRTPLSMILEPIRSVLEQAEELDEGSRERLAIARRNARHLERRVDQLLDLATLEAGTETLELRQGDLVETIRETVRSFAPMAERNRIELNFEPDLERVVIAFDPEKVSTVVRNLLSNALKFTPEDGTVRVRVEETEKEAVLRVRDTGAGIPEEEQPHLFERYYQVNDAEAHRHEGTGIGLALVKEFVELHEGVVEVESEPEFGTEFVVRLPKALSPAEEGEEGARAEEKEAPVFPDEQADAPTGPERPDETSEADENPTVLVVEDNADVRLLLRSQLSGEYRVVEAENGRAALERIEENPPDLVLSDVMMPEMDGLELCRRLRDNAETQDLPILLLTARAEETDQVEALDVGADDYVEKPFETNVLAARIDRLISRHRSLREQYSAEVVVQPTEVSISSDEEEFLERVRSVAEEHISDRTFTVEAFAAEVGLSKSQFTRRVKSASGYTPAAYLRELRFQRAAQLVEEGLSSVSEVARRVGYRDAEHFSKRFRERFGVPPSQYGSDKGGDVE